MEVRRQTAEQELISRKNSLFKKNSYIEKIDNNLNRTGAKLAKAVLNGSDVKEQVKLIKEATLKNQKELTRILSSMGLPVDYLNIQYTCPICKDTGFDDGKICVCLKKLMRDLAFEELNKLSPLAVSNFEDFDLSYYSDILSDKQRVSPRKRMTDIYKYCRNYATTFSLNSKNILMQGNTGLGKTHLSLAIAGKVIDSGFGVIYTSTPNLLSKIEKEHFSYNKSTSNTVDYIIDCDLLILDDLGTEFATNFTTTTIYNILNSRLLLSKPTIISTNLSIKDMEKMYGERFVSRVIGNNDRLLFLGKDLRQRIGGAR